MGLPESKGLHRQTTHLEALSDVITREIRTISLAMLQKTMDNFLARLQQCLDKNGRHLHDQY
jgi:hypothetical protein